LAFPHQTPSRWIALLLAARACDSKLSLLAGYTIVILDIFVISATNIIAKIISRKVTSASNISEMLSLTSLHFTCLFVSPFASVSVRSIYLVILIGHLKGYT